ncbi:MAG: hypothetical protein KC431_29855, partial [Myxococcales bacterium]|nr:hypothetical protein [Myxococcales bacterium]
MAGLPTSWRACVLMGAGALLLGACEGRTASFEDDGIGFGETGDESTDDGDSSDSSDSDSGDETGGSISCNASVESLAVDETTEQAAVQCVEEVAGDLEIGPTTTMEDLQMLANLRVVGGALTISANSALTSLEGLEQLESVGQLVIRRNHGLTDLHGLEGLQWIGRLTIDNNDGLKSLSGLPAGLSPIALDITKNDGLANLDGLPVFLPPGNGALAIVVEDNGKLGELGGLSDCCGEQSVTLRLARNPVLQHLSGLEGFARFEELRLHDNVGLVDLQGMGNVGEVGTFEVQYDHCVGQATPALVGVAGGEGLVKVGVMVVAWAPNLVS